MYGSGSGADMTIALARQGRGDNGTRPAQARQGRCNGGIITEVTRERENGHAMMHVDDQRRRGNGGTRMAEQG